MDNSPDIEVKSRLPDSSFSYRRYLFAFVAAMFIIDVLESLLAADIFSSSCGRLDVILLLNLVIAQACLLSIWAGIGRSAVTLRCFITLIFIECWSKLIPVIVPNAYNNYIGDTKVLFNYLILIFIGIAIPLWIGRFFGLHIINIREKTHDSRLSPRFQFSLRCLLEWVTIAAIFMGSLTYIYGKGQGFVLHADWFDIVFWSLGYVIICLLLTCAVFWVHWNTFNIMINLLAAFSILRILVFGAIPFFYGSDEKNSGLLHTMLIFYSSLWFFHFIGYRLAWNRELMR
jgi:hypothetical protein